MSYIPVKSPEVEGEIIYTYGLAVKNNPYLKSHPAPPNFKPRAPTRGQVIAQATMLTPFDSSPRRFLHFLKTRLQTRNVYI